MCFLVAFSASAVQGTATKRRTQLLNLNPTARLIKRKIRRYGQAVRQRSATPLSPVRFRVSPPKNPESSAFRIFSFVSAGHNTICVLARNIIWPKVNIIPPQADTNKRGCTSCKWCASQWCDASHQWCCASRKRIFSLVSWKTPKTVL